MDGGLAGNACGPEERTLRGGQMKRSAKIISYVIAIGLTTATVPQASAQAQTPPPAPPAAQQPQPQPQSQPKAQKDTHDKARGAAAGAAIGAATTGNAAKGAVVGAGHSRRQAEEGANGTNPPPFSSL